jgi:Zn-dependent protease with chaperone function
MFSQSIPAPNSSWQTHSAIVPPSRAENEAIVEPDKHKCRTSQSSPGPDTSTKTVPREVVERIDQKILGLNYKIALGEVARFGTYATGLAVGLPYIFTHASGPAFNLWLSLAGISATLGVAREALIHVALNVVSKLKSPHEVSPFEQRVTTLTASLAQKAGIPTPHVRVIDHKFFYAGMADRLSRKDIIVVSKQLESLTDTQLKGVLAHELAHGDRWHTKLSTAVRTLYDIASPTFFVCAWSGLYGAMARFGGGASASQSSLILSTVALMGATYLLTAASRFVSRANELKTDLRAAKITGEPHGLIEAIEVMVAASPKSHKANSKARLLGSHPPLSVRRDTLTQVFQGHNQPADSGDAR